MHSTTLATFLAASLALAGCAMAQETPAQTAPPAQPAPTDSPAAPAPQDAAQPAAAPAAPGTLTPDSPADQILDVLDARGENLIDFTADVRLTELDPIVAKETTRAGQAWYQKQGAGDERIRVAFNSRQGARGNIKERLEYVLDDGWLIERDYPRKSQIRRQVLRPGEKVALLKLGEGPFPLPLGQDKQDVHGMFDVKKLAPDAELDPEEAKTVPADTVRVQLIPKPQTQFAGDFSSIDVWVDLKTGMPRRVQTVDANGTTIRTTDLENVRVNAGVGDKEFALEKIDVEKDGWRDLMEPYGQ